MPTDDLPGPGDDAQHRAALRRALEASLAEADAGPTEDFAAVIA